MLCRICFGKGKPFPLAGIEIQGFFEIGIPTEFQLEIPN